MVDEIRQGESGTDLRAFILQANENIAARIQGYSSEFEVLSDIDGLYSNLAANFINLEDPISGMFFLRAHSSYRGGIRLSLSGQLPEAFMVFRGCLENALYGLYLHKNYEKQRVWLRRHDDEESLKKARREFLISNILCLSLSPV